MFRARASHLHERLPATDLARAAYGGLQDSAPRAGVLSLYARAEGLTPTSWEDPALVQIWFRGADYIVPRDDVAVFTLGRLPRDVTQHKAYEQLCDEVHDICAGEPCIAREVYAKLRDPSHEKSMLVRWASVTGRLHIRWDASKIWIVPAERPRTDPEDARLELARRFLGWFAPATSARFERWAGISTADARTSWDALQDELMAVQYVGREGFVHRDDERAMRNGKPISGVRLLPMDDPLVKTDKDLLVEDEALRPQVFPPVGTSPGYIAQALLIDGEIAGVWHRQARRVTVHSWKRLGKATREAVEQEAAGLPIAPLSKAVTVKWE